MTRRIERLRSLLAGKADCALVTDDINRRYLTRTLPEDQPAAAVSRIELIYNGCW